MPNNVYYKRIEIKGDRKNLPELGNYCTIHRKGRPEAETECYYYDFGGDFHILDDFDWYLLPVSTPETIVGPTEEDAKTEAIQEANRSQFLSNWIYEHKSVEYGFLKGAKYVLSQLKTVNLKDELVKAWDAYIEKVKMSGTMSLSFRTFIDDYLSGKGKEGE